MTLGEVASEEPGQRGWEYLAIADCSCYLTVLDKGNDAIHILGDW